ALALAEVDSDADAAIAGRFDCLDAAHAHADVEAALLRARHLGLVGTAGAAALEQARGDRLEAVQAALAVVGNGDVGGKRGGQWTILATGSKWRTTCAGGTKTAVN